MTVTVGMNNDKIIILTKPISYVQQKKQSMHSCAILKYIILPERYEFNTAIPLNTSIPPTPTSINL